MARFEREQSEYIEKVVATNRVSKTVKGGRVMKFSALMVVGDGKGKVGFGLGKAAEVPEAIRKGIEDAKKNMITVSLSGSTIPHEIIGEAGAGRVLMKPAAPGTGVIAGGPVRIIMEAAGIKDIRTKCLRSNTAVNVVAATFEGLKSLRTPEEVARTRGKSKILLDAHSGRAAAHRVLKESADNARTLVVRAVGDILAVEHYPARIYRKVAADGIKEGGFSRAV